MTQLLVVGAHLAVQPHDGRFGEGSELRRRCLGGRKKRHGACRNLQKAKSHATCAADAEAGRYHERRIMDGVVCNIRQSLASASRQNG